MSPLTRAQSSASRRPGKERAKSKAIGAARKPMALITPAPEGTISRGEPSAAATR